MLSDDEARNLLENEEIIWYQRYHLSPNVVTPGVHDIEDVLNQFELPDDLSGLHVLDIGTANGGAAFIAESRGASRVIAVDIFDPHQYGFAQIASASNSKIEFVKASVYELPALLHEKFDLIFFLGVLYHLRHPLLALDAVREIANDKILIDTEVSPSHPGVSHSEFYPAEYNGDASNWFVPSVRCVSDWLVSSGFDSRLVAAWPEPSPRRALFLARVTSDQPYWQTASYEQILRVTVPRD
jgi:tRNA (mo5U34)-methyltransferase